jgi:hypothetical protein
VEITVNLGLDMLTFLVDCDMYGTIPVIVRQEDSAAWKWLPHLKNNEFIVDDLSTRKTP